MTTKKKIVLAVVGFFGLIALFIGVVAITVLSGEVDPHIKADLEKMHAEGKVSDSDWQKIMADNKVTKFELLNLMRGK